jgi:hypothetical protein
MCESHQAVMDSRKQSAPPDTSTERGRAPAVEQANK